MPADAHASAIRGGTLALSIVVVNWHSRAFVERCLAAVEAETADLTYEILVIDSGSFDGCEALIADQYPQVRFIQSPINLGFGRANTVAAGLARGAVLLFLNPDTEVTGRAIERMYRHLLSHADAGAIGCRLLNTDGSLQTSSVQALPTILNHLLNADLIRRIAPKARLFGAAALFAREQAVTPVEAVSGACLMVARDVFARLGGFSPEYFMYGEDLDFCYKARAAGLQNYHASDAVVIHHGGGSSRQTVSRFATVLTVHAINLLLRKMRGAGYAACHRLGVIVAAAVRLGLLAAIAPAGFVCGRSRQWASAAAKWFFVLRWGFGFERWAAETEHSPAIPLR